MKIAESRKKMLWGEIKLFFVLGMKDKKEEMKWGKEHQKAHKNSDYKE